MAYLNKVVKNKNQNNAQYSKYRQQYYKHQTSSLSIIPPPQKKW